MADAVHESAFWLPSDFLTDDDFFFPPNRSLTFPHPSALLPPPPPPMFRRSSSALTSPGESETDGSADDPDEFLADLTRHLALSALRDRASKPLPPHSHEKAWGALATSPQSTLSGFASWPNHRATDDETLELIYAAAERVAKMRLNCQALMMKQRLSQLAAEARTPSVCYNAPPNNHHHHHQLHQIRTTARCDGLPHSSFPPLRVNQHSHAMRAPPAGIKKQSTGTGVFLPRRVGTATNNTNAAAPPPAEPRKKQGGCSTVLVPARVVQALNLHSQAHPQAQPCFPPLNHDMLVARRNGGVIMGQQQQRRGARGEPLLPQEWTY